MQRGPRGPPRTQGAPPPPKSAVVIPKRPDPEPVSMGEFPTDLKCRDCGQEFKTWYDLFSHGYVAHGKKIPYNPGL